MEIDEQSPDEDDRKAMQFIQDRQHNSLIYIPCCLFIISTHLYTQVEWEMNKQYPDGEDTHLYIQDRLSGLKYIPFVVFLSLLTYISK